jgi:hypothetical protein
MPIRRASRIRTGICEHQSRHFFLTIRNPRWSTSTALAINQLFIIVVMTPSTTAYLHDGFLCCYDGCDFENVVCGCVSAQDCLCIRYTDCFALGVPARGCGMTTQKDKDELVKCACIFAECGIIRPYNVCNSARKTCCCFWYVTRVFVTATNLI